MGNPLNRDEQNCRRFLDALEELPLGGGLRKSAEEWRAELPEAEDVHAGGCEACRTALEEFAETQWAGGSDGADAWTVVCDSRDGGN